MIKSLLPLACVLLVGCGATYRSFPSYAPPSHEMLDQLAVISGTSRGYRNSAWTCADVVAVDGRRIEKPNVTCGVAVLITPGTRTILARLRFEAHWETTTAFSLTSQRGHVYRVFMENRLNGRHSLWIVDETEGHPVTERKDIVCNIPRGRTGLNTCPSFY